MLYAMLYNDPPFKFRRHGDASNPEQPEALIERICKGKLPFQEHNGTYLEHIGNWRNGLEGRLHEATCRATWQEMH
jgi:hypothetical protein